MLRFCVSAIVRGFPRTSTESLPLEITARLVSSVSSGIKDLNYSILKEGDGDEVLQFMKENFFNRETMNVMTGASDYLERPAIKSLYVPSGVSLGARDPGTNHLVGVVLASTHDRGEEIPLYGQTFDHPGMKRLIALMTHMIEAHDVFKDPNINKMAKLAFIATLPGYGGQGLGAELSKRTEVLVKEKGCQLASGMIMNPISQKMMRNLGYDVAYSLKCSQDLVLNGEKIFHDSNLLPDSSVGIYVKYL